MSGPLFTVADVAVKLGLKPQRVSGKTEFHGPNPTGIGATKDGFFLREDGTGQDRNGTFYKCVEIAAIAGIDPGQYEPIAKFREKNGRVETPRANVGPRKTSQATKAPPQAATPPKSNNNGSSSSQGAKKKAFDWDAAIKFDYCDGGEMLFQVAKIGSGPEKQIKQRRPDGEGGWVYSLSADVYEPVARGGVNHWYHLKDKNNPSEAAREFPECPRVLYRRDEVKAASVVFLPEGESAADALNEKLRQSGRFGEFVATTNPHGAGKWRDEFAESLEGKTVIVLPDNDEPGKKHAGAVCASCHAHGATVKLIELPDLPPKGDVVDYFASGRMVGAVLTLAHNSPTWAPPAPERRFPLLTLAQLKAKPKPQFLIHGLLVKSDTSLLTAKHASFKSFISLAMALCIACGIPFYGYEVVQGRVIYIAAEGATGLTKRAQAWCAHHNIDPGDNFLVYNSPVQIHDAGQRAAFIEEIADLNPVLIVLDTLARCAVGLEENSSKDMGEFADALDLLAKESGAHVMTVHHNNKGGEYRGSSAIPAAVGTHISLERNGDSVTLKIEKQKDAEEIQDLVFEKLEVSIPGTYGEESSLVFQRVDTREGQGDTLGAMAEKVLNEFKGAFSEDGGTYSQIQSVCGSVGMNDRTIRRALKELTEKKVLECPNHGTRGARYYLVKSDEKDEGDKGTSRGHDPNAPKPSNEGDKGDTPLYRVSPCPPTTSERGNGFLAEKKISTKTAGQNPKRSADKGTPEPYVATPDLDKVVI